MEKPLTIFSVCLSAHEVHVTYSWDRLGREPSVAEIVWFAKSARVSN